MVQSKHHALAREAILAALTAYTGITTADGATPANNTLICADLIGKNDFISNKTILIGSGDADDESSGALSFATLTGIITVTDAFSAQIKAGVLFRIININIGDLAAIKDQVDKLAGEPVTEDSETKNWNASEQDLVSLGAASTKKKLHSLIVDISQLTATATITIRLYMKVNGTERKVYEENFVVGTDPDGCWVVNGTIGIHDVLRVTCQSDNAADDGKAIAYTYMLEAM